MLIFWAKRNCYEKKKDALLDISNVGSEVNSKNKNYYVHVLSPECETKYCIFPKFLQILVPD